VLATGVAASGGAAPKTIFLRFQPYMTETIAKSFLKKIVGEKNYFLGK